MNGYLTWVVVLVAVGLLGMGLLLVRLRGPARRLAQARAAFLGALRAGVAGLRAAMDTRRRIRTRRTAA